MSRSLPRLLIVGILGTVLGLVVEGAAFEWNNPRGWVPDLIVGWVLIGCGLVGLLRRPQSSIGPLLSASGFAWFLGSFWHLALYLHRGPLIHAVLSFPHGRMNSSLDRATVTAAYVIAVVVPLSRTEPVVVALGALLIFAAGRGVVRSMGPNRRARSAVLPAAAALGMVLVGSATARSAFPGETADEVILALYQVVLVGVAVGLLLQLVRAAWERVTVTDLIMGLQEARTNTVRDALARALGDPTLQIGYRAESGLYVDEAGREIELPEADSARAVTNVELDGKPVAALVHDLSVLQDPGLVESIAAAARMTAANAGLHAQVRAQIDELQASRRRLLQAAERERWRLERRLREGAEQRLKVLGGHLVLARTRATQTGRDELEGAIRQAELRLRAAEADLRELARGLHPFALVTTGLEGAIAELAEAAPVPTDVVASAEGVPHEVATTAYFICSEALANVARHAQASHCSIRIERKEERLLLTIADDGVGGAALSKGSGLRGLVDRLEILGGTLRVESRLGHGTRLIAEIPLSGEPGLEAVED